MAIIKKYCFNCIATERSVVIIIETTHGLEAGLFVPGIWDYLRTSSSTSCLFAGDGESGT